MGSKALLLKGMIQCELYSISLHPQLLREVSIVLIFILTRCRQAILSGPPLLFPPPFLSNYSGSFYKIYKRH